MNPRKKHPDSHLDHNLTPAQVDHVLARYADRTAFFLETFELPPDLGTVPCGLHGPLTGGLPVDETEVTRAKRGTRAWASRLVDRPPVQVRTVTIIAGPHDEPCPGCAGTECSVCNGTGQLHHACILFTAYGGPCAPQEPGDVRRQLEDLERTRSALPDRSPESTSEEHATIYAKIVALREKRTASDAFWAEHALSR